MGIIEKKEIRYRLFQILGENGNCNEKLMPKLPDKQIKEIYRYMVLARKFDEKAILLQRQGKLGTYPPINGQEASQVGSAYALTDNDWMFPTFRDIASYITRKTPLAMIYQYWNGDERGQKFPDKLKNFTMSIPIGSQIVQAAGCAFASKIKKEKSVTLVYFGDGATSEGDFHEGLNFAGVFKVPCVFLCENNQWAISVPRSKQTASKTLAQKAIAYGFDGIQVDGNDVFAVYKVVKEAVDKARKGLGPTLIECITYRIGVHTTSDDPTRYRDQNEVGKWKRKDPIARLKKYMGRKKLWSEMDEENLLREVDKEVREAVEEMEKVPKPDPLDMFKYVFAEIPEHLKDQMQYLESIMHKEKEG